MLQKSINQVIIDRSWITFKLVTSSIVLSFVIATLLAGWKLYIESKLRVLTRNIQLFFYFVISTISIAPAFWVASILFNFIHIFGEGNNTRVKLLFAILVLTVCDGNLAYLADGIKQKWSELLSKEFIKYADVRGLNLFDKIFKHFFPHIIGQMLILLRYRIIYFISAAVIVEMIYSILGVGFLFIEKGWGSEDAYTPLAILFYLAIIIGIYNAFVAFFIEKEERYCKIVNFYVSIASRLRDGLSPLILFLIKKQLIIKRLLLSAIILSILISIVVIMPNANKVESVSESEVIDLNIDQESDEDYIDIGKYKLENEMSKDLSKKIDIRIITVSIIATLFVTLIAFIVVCFVGWVCGFIVGSRGGIGKRIVDQLFILPLDLLPRLLVVIIIQIAIMRTDLYQSDFMTPWYKLALLALIIGVLNAAELVKLLHKRIDTIKKEDYFLLAKSNGTINNILLFKYVLPNCKLELIQGLVYNGIIASIFLESSLSFLDWGSPQELPTLGKLIWDNNPVFYGASWRVILPGFLLFSIITIIRLIGELLLYKYKPKAIVND